MGNSALTLAADEEAEDRLRGLLADAAFSGEGLAAILPPLLSGGARHAFSERIVASVRGLLEDLTSQLPADTAVSDLACRPSLLVHLHALAAEAELGQRMAHTLGVDPVVPPLLQDRAGAEAVIAAQVRFAQDMYRATLPLSELPAGLVDAKSEAGGESRLFVLDRFVREWPSQAQLLDPLQAGVSLFATALSRASGQSRDELVLAMTGWNVARLAVALRACRLGPSAIEACLFALCPDCPVPDEAIGLAPERAAELLRR